MPNAGLLDLVAHELQDIYLIGNPQITFFKVVYKRHTNFSMEVCKLILMAKLILVENLLLESLEKLI